jgi:hypothetical protein
MAAGGYLSNCRAITMRWMWPLPLQIPVTAKPQPVPRVDDTSRTGVSTFSTGTGLDGCKQDLTQLKIFRCWEAAKW